MTTAWWALRAENDEPVGLFLSKEERGDVYDTGVHVLRGVVGLRAQAQLDILYINLGQVV